MINQNSFMKKTIPAGAKQGLLEYLLIAPLGQEVYDRVMQEKQTFAFTYGQEAAISARPHITVSNFLARDEMEDTLIRWLQRIIGEQKSFTVTLDNYSGFSPHTLFLRVQDDTPFKELARQLMPIDSFIKSNECPPAKFIRYPHLSIARRLPAEIYKKAMADYAQKPFNESFQLNELVLLRRQHRHDVCKQVAIFRLQPQNDYSGN